MATKFITNIEKGDFQVEMLVDGEIFNKEIILKAAYELVDKVYMFFQKKGKNYIVQFKLKDKKDDLDTIVKSFWEELVFHDLRKQLEEQTWARREKIIETALWFSIWNEEIQNSIQEITKKLDTYYSASDIHITIENLEEIEKEIKETMEIMKKWDTKKNVKIKSQNIPAELGEIIENLNLIKIDEIDIKKYIKDITSIKKTFEIIIKDYNKTNSKKSFTDLEWVYNHLWKMVEELIKEQNRIEWKEVEQKKSIDEIIWEIKDDEDFTDEDKDEIIAILKDIED